MSEAAGSSRLRLSRRRDKLAIVSALAFGLTAAASVTAVAQERLVARLCLSVSVPAGITSVDEERATSMISSGEMRIVEVVPCDGPERDRGGPPVAVTPTPIMGTTVGEWFASEMRPEAEDGAIAIAGMNAVDGVSSLGVPITLAIRCSDGGIDLIVTWNDEILDEDPQVEFRVGSGATETHTARRSKDGFATFFPAGRAEAYLPTLYGETTLVATHTPSDGAVLTATFDVTGAEEALANVRAACGIG